MKEILFAEARALNAAGPFSFLNCGVRVTVINICGADVTTAANCVEEFQGKLIVTTWIRPLVNETAVSA